MIQESLFMNKDQSAMFAVQRASTQQGTEKLNDTTPCNLDSEDIDVNFCDELVLYAELSMKLCF